MVRTRKEINNVEQHVTRDEDRGHLAAESETRGIELMETTRRERASHLADSHKESKREKKYMCVCIKRKETREREGHAGEEMELRENETRARACEQNQFILSLSVRQTN